MGIGGKDIAVGAPLLSVWDLGVDFRLPGTTLNAVRGVSFDIAKGETLALVGESGSGKSVTAMSILQLLPYPTASHPTGSIRFAGVEMMGAAEPTLLDMRGGAISMIFQEPMTSLNPLHTIEKQISETLLIHRRMSRFQARARVIELLELVGLSHLTKRLNAYPHELSGGQRQRVMIAMALANEPQLLIADEPTTALDVTIQAQILDLLKSLQDRFHMALLLITHDLGVVRKMADRVCVMNQGEIVERSDCRALFEQPQHPYTKALLEAEPKGSPPPADTAANSVMSGEQIKVHFPVRRGVLRRTVDHVRAVDGIDLTIRAGQTLGVVGESGSGKSTLGMALIRLLGCGGEITFDGRRLQSLSPRELRPLRKSLQIVFQDPYGSLSPRLSVGEIIAEGLRIHRREMSAADRDKAIVSVLEATSRIS